MSGAFRLGVAWGDAMWIFTRYGFYFEYDARGTFGPREEGFRRRRCRARGEEEDNQEAW